jgi:hypothetical protein
MSPAPLPALPPLRTGRREAAPTFRWTHRTVAGDRRVESGWASFAAQDVSAASGALFRSLVETPEGAVAYALVLDFDTPPATPRLETWLEGRLGPSRFGTWRHAALVDGGPGQARRVVLPLAVPVEAGEGAALVRWEAAATRAAAWLSEQLGVTASARSPTEWLSFEGRGADARPGYATLVEGMRVSRRALEAYMMSIGLNRDADPNRSGLELDIGAMSWHVSWGEAYELFDRMQGLLLEPEDDKTPVRANALASFAAPSLLGRFVDGSKVAEAQALVAAPEGRAAVAAALAGLLAERGLLPAGARDAFAAALAGPSGAP